MATSVAIVAQLAHMSQDEDWWDTGEKRDMILDLLEGNIWTNQMIQEHLGATLYGQIIRENYGSKAYILCSGWLYKLAIV